MLNATNITPPRVPLVDDRTGLISREWYRFFLNLFVLTGNGASTATLEDLQLVPSAVDYTAELQTVADASQVSPSTNFAAEIARLRSDLEIGTQPPYEPAQVTGYATLPTAITVGASPFSYVNQTGYTVDVIVNGGTVSQTEFSRDGTTFYTVGTTGMFTLSPSDRLRVTYTVAPTMTLVSR